MVARSAPAQVVLSDAVGLTRNQINEHEYLTTIKARPGTSQAKVFQSETPAEDEMFRLMMTLFSMISTTLMGIAIVIALTIGQDTLRPLVIAAAIGFILAVPVSWLVAKRLS